MNLEMAFENATKDEYLLITNRSGQIIHRGRVTGIDTSDGRRKVTLDSGQYLAKVEGEVKVFPS